jgi:transposase
MLSRAYAARDVNALNVVALDEVHRGQDLWLGVDVGKFELKAVAHFGPGLFERPWSVENPSQIRLLIEQVKALSVGRKVRIAMEPSGTYGDALRQAADDAGLEVHRIPTKIAHDYAEVFDGVPSQHDGKDAAVIAELARLGKGARWKYEPACDWLGQLQYQVERLEIAQQQLRMVRGRLEALLARHWPEAIQLLSAGSGTLVRALMEYGGPRGLSQDGQAAAKVQRWGGNALQPATVAAVVESAQRSVGVRTTRIDEQRLKDRAAQALEARKQMRAARAQIKKLVKQNKTLESMGQAVGPATASMLWVYLGDPRDYHCADAYVKAMGLNLKERSSGICQGRLKISKRGPAPVRCWMYLAAWRLVRNGPVKNWYERKKLRDGKGGKALVGIMRRLGLAVWHVAVTGENFESSRLFPQARKIKKGR